MAIFMSASDDILVQAAAVLAEAADGRGEALGDAAIQAVLAAAVRAYAARVERGAKIATFSPDAVTATDIAVTTSAMLEAANIGIFELSMWQSLKNPSTSN